MVLRINLYHEVLRAKRQQQYDPLKLSLLALIIVVCLTAIQAIGTNANATFNSVAGVLPGGGS